MRNSQVAGDLVNWAKRLRESIGLDGVGWKRINLVLNMLSMRCL